MQGGLCSSIAVRHGPSRLSLPCHSRSRCHLGQLQVWEHSGLGVMSLEVLVTGHVSSDYSSLTPLWAGMSESCKARSISLGRWSGRGGLTDSLGQTLGWIAKAIA